MSRVFAVLTFALVTGVAFLLLGLRQAPPATSARPGDVWFAAVLRDGSLLPFAAWTGGQSWAGWKIGDEVPRAATIDDLPPEWMPGAPLPLEWQVRLSDNRRRIATLSRAVHANPMLLTLVLDSDLKVPAEARTEEFPPEIGLATAGDVAIRPFEQAPQEALTVALRTATAAMLQAESHALERARDRGELPADVLNHLPLDMRAAALMRILTAAVVSDDEGSRTFYVEGVKDFDDYPADCRPVVHVSVAIAAREASLEPTMVTALATNSCEAVVSRAPLALVERRGQRCWVVRHDYEDGADYALIAPPAAGGVDVPCTPPR